MNCKNTCCLKRIFNKAYATGAKAVWEIKIPCFYAGQQLVLVLLIKDPILSLHLPLHRYTTVCGHSFKLVDLAISATPAADRCIKLSTPPCNLHRQTLEVEWLYWRAQWHSTWHRHRMPPFQQVSSSKFCPARAAPVNCKCWYCEVETSRSNNGSAAKL